MSKEFNYGDTPAVVTASSRIEKLRVDMDALMQAIVAYNKSSMGFAAGYHELEKARMWLGTCLYEMKGSSPYTATEIQRAFGNSKEIAPPEHKCSSAMVLPADRLETVDEVRKKLFEFIAEAKIIFNCVVEEANSNHWAIVSAEEAVKYIILSRNFFGTEYNELRK